MAGACLWLLLLGALVDVQPQQCDQPLINNVADFILQSLLANYPDTVQLANISSSFLYNTGTIQANVGSLGRVSTIRREGDLVLNFYNNSVQIILPVTFLHLTVIYEYYKLNIAGMSTSGRLETTVVENMVQIDATMGDKSLCFITINNIKFMKLGDFNVRLTSNCHSCSKITSSILSSALNFFKTRIRSLIEAKVNETLYKIIKPDNPMICKNLNVMFNEDKKV